jgi:hypothetical protein
MTGGKMKTVIMAMMMIGVSNAWAVSLECVGRSPSLEMRVMEVGCRISVPYIKSTLLDTLDGESGTLYVETAMTFPSHPDPDPRSHWDRCDNPRGYPRTYRLPIALGFGSWKIVVDGAALGNLQLKRPYGEEESCRVTGIQLVSD